MSPGSSCSRTGSLCPIISHFHFNRTIILIVESNGLNENDDEAAKIIIDQYMQIKKEVVPAVDEEVEECVKYLTARTYPPLHLLLVLYLLFEVQS